MKKQTGEQAAGPAGQPAINDFGNTNTTEGRTERTAAQKAADSSSTPGAIAGSESGHSCMVGSSASRTGETRPETAAFCSPGSRPEVSALVSPLPTKE